MSSQIQPDRSRRTVCLFELHHVELQCFCNAKRRLHTDMNTIQYKECNHSSICNEHEPMSDEMPPI